MYEHDHGRGSWERAEGGGHWLIIVASALGPAPYLHHVQAIGLAGLVGVGLLMAGAVFVVGLLVAR